MGRSFCENDHLIIEQVSAQVKLLLKVSSFESHYLLDKPDFQTNTRIEPRPCYDDGQGAPSLAHFVNRSKVSCAEPATGSRQNNGGNDAYAKNSTSFAKGMVRMRLPVAAKMALAKAGTAGGVPGSPAPPMISVVRTSST